MVATSENKPLTMTEDACTVSKELAEYGMFSWYGYIDYPLPKDLEHIRVGVTVKDQSWWAPAVKGCGQGHKDEQDGGDTIAVIYIASKVLEVEDKLGTYHGLKLTGGEIVPYD